MIKFERITKQKNDDQGFIITPSIIWLWKKPEEEESKTFRGLIVGWLLWFVQIDNEKKAKQYA
jgi:hypothetical protein